jgi:toxin-antitoxin system PIN domain toxin
VIIPDLNLLLYAYDTESPHHAEAVDWWQICLSSSTAVGLPGVVLFGFMRLSTSLYAYRMPMTPKVAAKHIQSWLEQPCAQVIEPGRRHIHHVLELLVQIGTAGNLVTDAQIAALAIEYDAVIHTADTDFLRFPGVRWWNPLIKAGN